MSEPVKAALILGACIVAAVAIWTYAASFRTLGAFRSCPRSHLGLTPRLLMFPAARLMPIGQLNDDDPITPEEEAAFAAKLAEDADDPEADLAAKERWAAVYLAAFDAHPECRTIGDLERVDPQLRARAQLASVGRDRMPH